MSIHFVRNTADVDHIISSALRSRGVPDVINAEFRDLVTAYAEERFGSTGNFADDEIEEISNFIVRLFELAGPRA